MKLLIFDDGEGVFGPLRAMRPIFDQRSGAWTTRERIERRWGARADALIVPAELEAVARERETVAVNPAFMPQPEARPNGADRHADQRGAGRQAADRRPVGEHDRGRGRTHDARERPGADRVDDSDGPSTPWLAVNGRWLNPTLPTDPEPGDEARGPGGQVLWRATDAGVLSRTATRMSGGSTDTPTPHGANDQAARATSVPDALIADRPWHFIDTLGRMLREDLETLAADETARSSAGLTSTPTSTATSTATATSAAASDSASAAGSASASDTGADPPAIDPASQTRRWPDLRILGDHPVRVAPTANLHPFVVLDAREGPIRIEQHAIVGAHAVVLGPCSVGPGCEIRPHALIRAHCSFGPACVVGGEVNHSVFQAHAAKPHDGYLGHAIVGEWVNLGAGATASNLKNTYGSVRVRLSPDREPEDSGRTKLGPLIGDFVHLAVLTRLNTGACLGAGAMIACSHPPPDCVPPLSFLTDQGRRRYDENRLREVVARLLARHGLSPGEAAMRRLLSLDADRPPKKVSG